MNPDHALVRDFLNGDRRPVRVNTNPLAQSLKTELIAADGEAGAVSLAFEPGAEFLQGRAVVQGGIVSAMLDFAAAFAVLAKLPIERTAATACLSINFLSAAHAGRFIAHARIDRLGSRLAYISARLEREGDENALIATASAVMAVSEQR
jgi:uncharacterized protein (TIGR00369 family)